MTTERINQMTTLLNEHLRVLALEIIDESAKHAGHAGARDGRGHFKLNICATDFDGMSTLKRHRLIYSVLGDMMQTDIHALSIHAFDSNSLPTTSIQSQ